MKRQLLVMGLIILLSINIVCGLFDRKLFTTNVIIPNATVNEYTINQSIYAHEIWVNRSGDTMTGPLNMSGNNITHVDHVWVDKLQSNAGNVNINVLSQMFMIDKIIDFTDGYGLEWDTFTSIKYTDPDLVIKAIQIGDGNIIFQASGIVESEQAFKVSDGGGGGGTVTLQSGIPNAELLTDTDEFDIQAQVNFKDKIDQTLTGLVGGDTGAFFSSRMDSGAGGTQFSALEFQATTSHNTGTQTQVRALTGEARHADVGTVTNLWGGFFETIPFDNEDNLITNAIGVQATYNPNLNAVGRVTNAKSLVLDYNTQKTTVTTGANLWLNSYSNTSGNTTNFYQGYIEDAENPFPKGTAYGIWLEGADDGLIVLDEDDKRGATIYGEDQDCPQFWNNSILRMHFGCGMFIEEDLLVGIANITNYIEVISINPNASGTETVGVKFFESVKTDERPQVQLFGDDGTGKKYITIGLETFGRMEIDGTASALIFNIDLALFDNDDFSFGNGGDYAQRWAIGGNDFLFMGLKPESSSTRSGNIIIGNYSDRAKDYGHDPNHDIAVYLHSGINVNEDNTQWMMLKHDRENGIIELGKGALIIRARNDSNISLYTEQNISATGFITRTSVFDKSQGDALDIIKDADLLTYENGSINHTAFYGYAGTTSIIDYSRPEIEQYVDEECEQVLVKNETEIEERCDIVGGSIVCENITSYIPMYEQINCIKVIAERNIYPHKKIEEGVMLDREINLVTQSIAEYRSAVDVKLINGSNYTSPALDTGTLMVEDILTKSKVPKPDKDYLKDLKDIEKLSNKETHYAKKNIDVEGINTSMLDMEERIVLLEGALNQMITEVCAKEGNKWSWCQ